MKKSKISLICAILFAAIAAQSQNFNFAKCPPQPCDTCEVVLSVPGGPVVLWKDDTTAVAIFYDNGIPVQASGDFTKTGQNIYVGDNFFYSIEDGVWAIRDGMVTKWGVASSDMNFDRPVAQGFLSDKSPVWVNGSYVYIHSADGASPTNLRSYGAKISNGGVVVKLVIFDGYVVIRPDQSKVCISGVNIVD